MYRTKETFHFLPFLLPLYLSFSTPMSPFPFSMGVFATPPFSVLSPPPFSSLSASGTLSLCAYLIAQPGSVWLWQWYLGLGIQECLLFICCVATSVVAFSLWYTTCRLILPCDATPGVGWYCPAMPPQYSFSPSHSSLRPHTLDPCSQPSRCYHPLWLVPQDGGLPAEFVSLFVAFDPLVPRAKIVSWGLVEFRVGKLSHERSRDNCPGKINKAETLKTVPIREKGPPSYHKTRIFVLVKNPRRILVFRVNFAYFVRFFFPFAVDGSQLLRPSALRVFRCAVTPYSRVTECVDYHPPQGRPTWELGAERRPPIGWIHPAIVLYCIVFVARTEPYEFPSWKWL